MTAKKLSIAFWTILLISCGKNSSSPSQASIPPQTLPPATNLIEYFPNKVNDEWVYDLIDSTANNNIKNQTLTVTSDALAHLILLDGQHANGTGWTYKYSNSDTSEYKFVYSNNGYTHKIRGLSPEPDYSCLNFRYELPDARYKLPLTVGDSYISNGALDTTKVLSMTSIKIGDRVYDSAYLINTKQLLYLGNNPEYFNIDEWFVPHVGTVKLNFDEYTDYYVIKKYRLLLKSKTLY